MTGPDDMQLHRDIGRLEGRVAALESQVAEMKEMVSAMHDTMMQARGSWRLMLVVGSAAAGVGALIASLLGAFHK